MDDQPTADLEPSEETPAPTPGRRRTPERASMRDELLALFRDTERSLRLSAEASVQTAASASPDVSTGPGPSATPAGPPFEVTAPSGVTTPSRFLRKYLHPTFPSVEPAPSGISGLDSRLGGGFSAGLHLVLGTPGSPKTVFLESVAWEAASSKRPVIYYALEEGGLRVWERLIGTVGCILGGSSVSLRALRARTLPPQEVQMVTRLDEALQTHVFPYLAIVDALPASSFNTPTMSTFIEDLRTRSHEAIEQHGSLPLLLLDSVERLQFLTGSDPLPLLLSRLESTLAADSMPGVLASAAAADSLLGIGRLPVKTVLVLESVPGSSHGDFSRIDLVVRENVQSGWTGALSLLLDQQTGLFSES